jgi:hypothetical protein
MKETESLSETLWMKPGTTMIVQNIRQESCYALPVEKEI